MCRILLPGHNSVPLSCCNHCLCFCLCSLHTPSICIKYKNSAMGICFTLLVSLFPVTYLMKGQLRAKNIGEGEEAERFTTLLAVEGARMSLLGLYAMIFMLIALEIKLELASLFREKALDRGVAPSQFGRNSGFPPKIRLIQQRRVSAPPSFTIKRLAAEAAWMPAVGNVSTVLCFIICLILNMHLTGGSNRAIFFLAPILLLLNQDSDIFAGFGDRQRDFPVTVAISGYLVLTALFIQDMGGSLAWKCWLGGLKLEGLDGFSRLRMLLFLFSPCLTTFSSTALCGTM